MHAVKRKVRMKPAAVLVVVLLAAIFLVALRWGHTDSPAGETPSPAEPAAAGVIGADIDPAREPEGGEPEPSPVPQQPARAIDPDKPMVALTFDDGPSGEYSPRILDCLEANGAVATFFEIGCNVDSYPEIDKRAWDLGCEIGCHSYYHKVLPGQTPEQIAEDQRLCRGAFEKAIGVEPSIIRPPQGSVVKSILSQYEQIFVGWSVDTEDWLYKSVDHTVSRVKQAGDLDGQVILMHSIYKESAEAAEILVPWLLEQGYQLVTVSELFQHHYGITPESHYYYAYDYFISDGALMLS